jgi:hypothetical protein
MYSLFIRRIVQGRLENNPNRPCQGGGSGPGEGSSHDSDHSFVTPHDRLSGISATLP